MGFEFHQDNIIETRPDCRRRPAFIAAAAANNAVRALDETFVRNVHDRSTCLPGTVHGVLVLSTKFPGTNSHGDVFRKKDACWWTEDAVNALAGIEIRRRDSAALDCDTGRFHLSRRFTIVTPTILSSEGI